MISIDAIEPSRRTAQPATRPSFRHRPASSSLISSSWLPVFLIQLSTMVWLLTNSKRLAGKYFAWCVGQRG
jgi:hypothetical protein